ncbi:MAG: hypothetical protein COB89_06730 [Piscirickettsiaceae bacterium]|nr:MAG: hypothetical protein COB89_06730 [Piscirickettsiaceae bacterium]
MKVFLSILILLFSTSLLAIDFSGSKKIYLVSSANELTHFANVEFTPAGDKVAYKVSIVDKPFENQFLSMRPFKCLMGKKQVMCHVPYPYDKSGFITESDLTELSYDILFLHKNPAEYGINLWNGIFYQLSLTDKDIQGVVYEVDMNTIASPPETDDLPFTEDDVFEADLDNYAYPRVLIK